MSPLHLNIIFLIDVNQRNKTSLCNEPRFIQQTKNNWNLCIFFFYFLSQIQILGKIASLWKKTIWKPDHAIFFNLISESSENHSLKRYMGKSWINRSIYIYYKPCLSACIETVQDESQEWTELGRWLDLTIQIFAIKNSSASRRSGI